MNNNEKLTLLERLTLTSPVATSGRAGAPSAHHISGDYEYVVYEEDGPIARLTLNRPRVRNALSIRLSDELIHGLERVRDSSTTKVLVLRGAGGTFCAGDDITEMGQWGTAEAVMRRVHGYQHMANVLEEVDNVTVAAVEGYAVGGGLELTMACDFVIAAASARWGMPEVDVGITPGWGGTTRLARLVGRRVAKEVNLLGGLYPASRAASLGLWNRVVPDADLDQELDRLITVLLSKNQQAVRQLKFIINNGVEADLHTAQAFEALSAGLTGAVSGGWQVPDGDAGAGVAGFATKNDLWQSRRAMAKEFWTDGPDVAAAAE